MTTKGETPYNLSSNKEVQILLEGVPYTKEQQKLPITPNYLSSPPLYVSKTSTIMPKSSEVINHDNSEGAVKTNEGKIDE